MGWRLLYYMDGANAVITWNSSCTVCPGVVAYGKNRIRDHSRDLSPCLPIYQKSSWAPIIGTLNDRWNRRIVMIVSDTLVAAAMAGLAGLFWMDIIEIWHIYAVNFLASIGRAFQGLAMITSTPLMVPEKHLARIQGTNQTLHGALSMGGPPLGALALVVFEIHIILAIDVLTAMLAIGPLLFIMIPQPKRMEEKRSQGVGIWADMLGGFRYLWRWSGLRNLILIAAVLNIFGNTKMTISPLLITDHFNGGATELGWFNSAWGMGIVLGGLLVGAWGGFRRRIMTTIFGWIVYGIGDNTRGYRPSYPPCFSHHGHSFKRRR